jgi:hypothetical protein
VINWVIWWGGAEHKQLESEATVLWREQEGDAGERGREEQQVKRERKRESKGQWCSAAEQRTLSPALVTVPPIAASAGWLGACAAADMAHICAAWLLPQGRIPREFVWE